MQIQLSFGYQLTDPLFRLVLSAVNIYAIIEFFIHAVRQSNNSLPMFVIVSPWSLVICIVNVWGKPLHIKELERGNSQNCFKDFLPQLVFIPCSTLFSSFRLEQLSCLLTKDRVGQESSTLLAFVATKAPWRFG